MNETYNTLKEKLDQYEDVMKFTTDGELKKEEE
jgi:hypothetical protein